MKQISKTLNWWESDSFDIDEPVPEELVELSGPSGIATVGVHEGGSTQPGWGQVEFMGRYKNNEFRSRSKEFAFRQTGKPFAIVMRSVAAICIDIDGKNNGFEGVKKLGLLPPTLAETSKSGNGLHLFYKSNDVWEPSLGYNMFPDFVNIAPGVDIRAIGCVYHYQQQRWNNRTAAELPAAVADMLNQKQQIKQAFASTKVVASDEGVDEVDIAMHHAKLLEDLRAPIPAGNRNNTLFAIGSQMMQSEYPNWEDEVRKAALAAGLDAAEVYKLVGNITKYGDSA